MIMSGDSQERSTDNAATIIALPTSAPSITASADATGMRLGVTNDDTLSAVAVLL